MLLSNYYIYLSKCNDTLPNVQMLLSFNYFFNKYIVNEILEKEEIGIYFLSEVFFN